MIRAQIAKMCKKFTCLQADDVAEEIRAIFEYKLTVAISERKIQLCRVNYKMMNTYLSTMLHNIMRDEIKRLQKMHSDYVPIHDINDNETGIKSTSQDKLLASHAFASSEETIIAHEALKELLSVLKKTNMNQYKLMKQIMRPGNDINLSCYAVQELRKRAAEILFQE